MKYLYSFMVSKIYTPSLLNFFSVSLYLCGIYMKQSIYLLSHNCGTSEVLATFCELKKSHTTFSCVLLCIPLIVLGLIEKRTLFLVSCILYLYSKDCSIYWDLHLNHDTILISKERIHQKKKKNSKERKLIILTWVV